MSFEIKAIKRSQVKKKKKENLPIAHILGRSHFGRDVN